MDLRGHPRGFASLLAPLAIVVFIAVATAVVTWRQSAGQDAIGLMGATLDASSLPVTVPLRRSGGQLLIDVAFGDGGRDEPMLVDTGAATMISAEVAARMGVVASGSVETIGPDGTVVLGRTVRLERLRIGGVTFSEVGAIVVSPGSASVLLGSAAGVIGANVMQRAVWQLDVPAGRLTIADSIAGLGHIDGAISLPFRAASPSSPSPLVDIGVGAGRLPFLVDTGSDGGLAAGASDLAGLGIALDRARPPERMPITSWSGRREALVAPVATRLTLGDGPPRWRVVLATDALARGMGIMGTDFLADFVLTIDWPSRRLYLDPVSGTAG